MQNKICIRIAIALSSVLGITSPEAAQSNVDELKAIILQGDSLFWAGYNTCDTSLTGRFIADNLEFFHDKGGLTKGKAALQLSLKKNLCSNPDWHLRRVAVPGTVQFFPLANNGELYGAILQGEHYFYVTEKGKPEFRDGRAHFNHLWLKENGRWVMVRILSYNHHAAEPETGGAIKLPAATLQQYTGRYSGPENDNVTVAVANDGLLIKAGNHSLVVQASSETEFFSSERPLKFSFVKNSAGKVTSLKVLEKGTVTEELKKVE
ncbi:DUF3471 domain-containing protein [Paraflavitalea pollutisoli]|uniref:nuclear transport factor 2 family protein n=1 Tax=Paraflavitalea pollutisoli TaxID=3034143 RepID=UPI0023ECDF55|nr:DUF3471 domain-containing protein [Paraflavitalea sp. H1-2-19X]